MPELPEVEVVCRLIKPHLVGHSFETIEKYTDKLRYPITVDTCPDLLHSNIYDVRRYGRYIVMELENLSGVIFHLGMTGQMKIVGHDTPREPHDHIVFALPSGNDLRFNCVRKFGFVEPCHLKEQGGVPEQLPVLGPDPLSDLFSAEYLYEITQLRRTPIKSLLMDNSVVPGIGNIYSAEVLFDVGLSPKTPANRLDWEHVQKVVASIKKTLLLSIEAGMTFNKNVDQPRGTEWKYPVEFAVYGRDGEPCFRCSETISKFKQGGRSCFFCPQCQS